MQQQQWLAQCDVLAMPAAPQRAFAFGTPVPANQADLTAYANMAGNPALSLAGALDWPQASLGISFAAKPDTGKVLDQAFVDTRPE